MSEFGAISTGCEGRQTDSALTTGYKIVVSGSLFWKPAPWENIG
jgi:hypothetical protein